MRVAVIGVGLIGGSIGMAASQRLDAETVGFDPDALALALALERGAISHAAGSLEEAVEGADAVFVAAPVSALPALIAEALDAAGPEAVISDVGSTKREVAAVDDERFVGGHPLAGAETAGVGHARADLFDGAVWYLTPTERTSGIRYERLHRMLSAIGARPVAIDPQTHDTLLAIVSHLPHVLANVLAAQAASALGTLGQQLPAAGPSFRDATRVAGASSAIWTDIYMSNRDMLGHAIDETIDRLRVVRETLRAGDATAVTAWNDGAAEARHQLLEPQLGAGELRELRVSVPNRPGVVAHLALELGRAGVNIPDMALYPAPDMSEGVIAFWVAGEDAAAQAQTIIASLGFPVFRA
jgi:prephenate dehydrogenase